ncbi:retrovirus-related pol polyprotein from transposon tnt 1-94 [Cucumis melo var. makuwa]|uniref:Retrovirus-related pol polyprotein from transposon tnt 1-94 n=2 Tax=Cucumis melo var. makuwa TaxID=1194695 RepID=A0A5D3DY06_CUCMM|nr:retrovirus-related pol polyprotein from transposon tnt 1-94 [Cucumis melo var. makuwa]
MNKIKRFAPSSSRSKKIQKKKGEKGKGPTAVVEGKRKAKIAIKGKCFHFNMDGHWKINFHKYLETTNSFKQLEEGEMTVKVEKGDVISACELGDIRRLVKNKLLNELEDDSLPPCESCLEGKTKRPFTRKGYRAKEPLELEHSDLCGPMNVKDDGVEDPLSYKQAMNDVDEDQWVKAMDLKWSLFTFYDYEIWQMDVKTAFLNDNLEDNIYMSQPEGFITQGQKKKVCKLSRSIYGLKQASRSWNIRFDTTIKSYSFDQNIDKSCVYKKINKGKVAFLVHYVDDILLIGNDVRYLTDINLTPQEVEDMRRIPYASTVGSLMYVMLCTRPDICYTMGIVSRYHSNPGLDHWAMVKIFSRSVCMLNGGAVIWHSIKQECIADSTMAVVYVATCETAKEAVWFKKFLHDLEVVPNVNLSITQYCDNSGTVANSKEPRSHKRGKHIKRNYYLIREIVQQRDVIVTKIASEHNIVDLFTKTLTAKVFEDNLENLGLRDMYIR